MKGEDEEERNDNKLYIGTRLQEKAVKEDSNITHFIRMYMYIYVCTSSSNRQEDLMR